MQEDKKNNIDDTEDEGDDEINNAEDELQPNDYNVEDEPFFLVLANYFESELVQLLIIFLSFLDIALCLSQSYYDYGIFPEYDEYKTLFRLFSHLPMVMLTLFITELFILFFAYGPATLTHLGYLSEIVVYSICFSNSLNPYNWRLIRLLFIIRLWRLQRLFSNPTAVLKQENSHLSKKVKQYKEKIKSLQKELEILNDQIEKEQFQRKELEQSVNESTIEIETLREALEIAAHAVVEAEMGGPAPGTETDINIQPDGGYEVTKKHYDLPMEDIDYNEGFYELPPPS